MMHHKNSERKLISLLGKLIVQHETLGTIKVPPGILSECQYLFYTSILTQLIQWHILRGANITASLKLLREGVISENHFSRRLSEQTNGGRIQIVMMFLMMMSFVGTLIFMDLSPCSSWQYGAFCVWIITGIGFWEAGLKLLYEWLLSSFARYYEALFALWALLSSGGVLQEAPSSLFTLLRDKSPPRFLASIHHELKTLLVLFQEQGRGSQNEGGTVEIQTLVEELLFLQKERFELFTRYSQILKLLILSLFLVAPYLLIIFSLFSKQLSQALL